MFLSDVRVLDLTDHRGETGPWLLGWLGADVIKVEPPGGNSVRLLRGAQWEAYNSDKRSIALDLAAGSDRDAFLELVAGADIVFDSGPPGAIAAAGIAESDLAAANPTLVHVLVTAFGADGPRAEQPSSELSIAALGGPMSLQGVRERAPVKASVPQVWRHAGVEAAGAALVALRHMENTGRPQWIDVSAQNAMTWTMLNAMEAHEVQGFDFERAGMTVQLAVQMSLGHLATDGWFCQAPAGITIGPIVPWLIEEGIAPAAWADEDWATFDHRMLSGEASHITYDDLSKAIDDLGARYTRHELLIRGLEYGSTFAPVNTIPDLLDFDHLWLRGYWRQADDGVRLPGAPLTVDGVRLEVPAGEASLDGAGEALRARPGRRRRAPTQRAATSLPLDGIKVADFSWIGVGPITARHLADHGATVVRVENEGRLDTLRAQAPFKDGEFGINRSNFFGSFNASKLSLGLDLSNDTGVEVAKRLTQWADVVIDSFRPGTMDKLGLGPEQIHATNPAAIVVTTSLLGGGGPCSALAGYGFHAGAIAGFTDLVGWPDLGPDGPWMAYTDTIGPRFLVPTILAALDRRERTGEGCAIEAAQLEMALHFLAPELLDHQKTGRVPSRNGNRDAGVAPQGVYPSVGDDEWVAITVDTDDRWARLRAALGDPEWASHVALDTVAGRESRQDELDRHIGDWTRQRTAEDAEATLARHGVPAGKVQRSADLPHDPQYRHRGFYRRLEHSEVGEVPYAGHQYRIRGLDHGPRSAAPCLGEHTFEVLTELLEMTEDEVAEVAASGALG